MGIVLKVPAGTKVIEYGGGANRNPATTVNVDVRKVDGVDIVVDFDHPPYPLADNEFPVALCFPEGTIVAGSATPIEDLETGGHVGAHNGDEQRVLKTYRRKYTGDMTRVQVGCVPDVLATPEHPILTTRLRRVHKTKSAPGKKATYENVVSPPVWKKAKDVTKGDWVIVPRLTGAETPVLRFGVGNKSAKKINVLLDEGVAWLLGAYVAEGHTTYRKTKSGDIRGGIVYFSIGASEGQFGHRIVQGLRDLGLRAALERPPAMLKNGSMRVASNCLQLARLLDEHCGKGARGKRVPEFIKRAPAEVVRAFISGLVEGDGCHFGGERECEAGGSVVSTVSRRLAYGLLELLHKLKIHARLSEHPAPANPVIQGRQVNSVEHYTVAWSARSWGSLLGRRGKVPYGWARFIEDKVYLPVRDVKTERVHEITVYNIHTQDETYGVPYTVHNCSYCIEHLSFPNVLPFLKEVHRNLQPGGMAVFLTPNLEAQFDWIKNHPEGWDGKDLFTAASELLYGSQDYEANTHKCFLTPTTAKALFEAAGFESVQVSPHGERDTDLSIQARKPLAQAEQAAGETQPAAPAEPKADPLAGLTREEMFDHEYFGGGGKVGGYAREGYWDYPVHHATARHILARRPESALEIGCARGYILKRLQDAGVRAYGMEVSKHCYLTRVCDNITVQDVCARETWPFDAFDLCYSVATLEHIPEDRVPKVIQEMARVCKRGLHGIDFGHKDDGFDKTHVCLKPREWWVEQFATHAPGWPVELLDKEDLEAGGVPPEIIKGDGKVKLNLGSYTCMFHHGWVNIDQHDLAGWAQHYGYRYQRHDLLTGIPFGTGTVDLIFTSHMLEHFTYQQGLAFLRECRRVLKPDTGAMRIIVPDAKLLVSRYLGGGEDSLGNPTVDPDGLSGFDEINEEAANSPSAAGKLHALLYGGDHKALYDAETLVRMCDEAGFVARQTKFRSNDHPSDGTKCRHPGLKQILVECNDMFPELSLVVTAVPRVG